MRKALIISVAAHVIILGAVFVAFPDFRPFSEPAVETLPVELVSVGDVTDLAKGSRTAEAVAENEPQTRPSLKDEERLKSVIAEADKPGKSVRVVSTSRTSPPAPSATVKMEKAPAPTKAVKVAAAEPEPAAPKVPAQAAATEPPPPSAEQAAALPKPPSIRPRARPAPPTRIARAEPDEPRPATAPATESAPPRSLLTETVQPAPTPPVDLREPSFRSRDIAALLDKRDPAAAAAPDASQAPQTLGIDDGSNRAAMTVSEIDALKASLHRCWSPPRGVREAGALQVTVGIDLNPDGSLAGHPRVLTSAYDTLTQIAAESAVRAVYSCAPFNMLPPEKYALWRNIEFTFDPREMLGG